MAKDLTPDAWFTYYSLDGSAQVETATAVGTVTANGNATVVITATAITGSPLTVSVAVLNTDTAATWAGKVRTALLATAAVTVAYTVGGSGAAITLTRVYADANDTTLNISLDNGTCTGITTAASSANTSAGVIATNITLPIASVTGLTAAEANTATGDIRQVMLKFLGKILTTYTALITADKPTTLTITKSANLLTTSFTVTVSGSSGAFVPGTDV